MLLKSFTDIGAVFFNKIVKRNEYFFFHSILFKVLIAKVGTHDDIGILTACKEQIQLFRCIVAWHEYQVDIISRRLL